MDISVIIVSHNSREVLPRCLNSLETIRNELSFEAIVVDNGSSDGCIEEIENSYPNIQIHRAGKNLGFAAGCNLGLARARGRHLMLLNPDTEVMPGALVRLVTALDDHPMWGVVGPRMVDGQDNPYPAARRFPRPFDVFSECTRLSYLFPRSWLFASYFYGDHKLNELDEVDQVEGSALVIKG
ncbi:glycosyltransferase family 2 protein, partial [bacterium]|nr:glycosyltransferase family 2 protein [bacterium]